MNDTPLYITRGEMHNEITAARDSIIKDVKLWFFMGFASLIVLAGAGLVYNAYQMGRIVSVFEDTVALANKNHQVLEDRSPWMVDRVLLEAWIIETIAEKHGIAPPSYVLPNRDGTVRRPVPVVPKPEPAPRVQDM